MDEKTLEPEPEDRGYEPPTITVLGKVAELVSEGDVTLPVG